LVKGLTPLQCWELYFHDTFVFIVKLRRLKFENILLWLSSERINMLPSTKRKKQDEVRNSTFTSVVFYVCMNVTEQEERR